MNFFFLLQLRHQFVQIFSLPKPHLAWVSFFYVIKHSTSLCYSSYHTGLYPLIYSCFLQYRLLHVHQILFSFLVCYLSQSPLQLSVAM